MALGFQILALSADRPEKLKPTVEQHSLSYEILADKRLAAAKAFGIAFQLDDKTVQAYKGYGIDLEGASGESHHQLPVPAVFIADGDGKIAFQYVNPDYKIRVPASVVLAMVKELAD